MFDFVSFIGGLLSSLSLLFHHIVAPFSRKKIEALIASRLFENSSNSSKKGYEEFTEDLDVITFIRRLRMHGIGLYQLLSQKEREICAQKAMFKPINQEKPQPGWNSIENVQESFYENCQIKGTPQAAQKTESGPEG